MKGAKDGLFTNTTTIFSYFLRCGTYATQHTSRYETTYSITSGRSLHDTFLRMTASEVVYWPCSPTVRAVRLLARVVREVDLERKGQHRATRLARPATRPLLVRPHRRGGAWRGGLGLIVGIKELCAALSQSPGAARAAPGVLVHYRVWKTLDGF